ncbi:NADPH:quinone reductase [Rhodococcus zopfii]|uniref:NADPH:quinone reductase n=1 Tax=Rhodococcus zopfii TaxID=43772 RepID=UPI001C3FB461|nr:NADPH:quinone reductase [Rhodococcus zopfii]
MPVPDHMHAAYVESLGGTDAIRYGLLPVPRCGPGEVLLRVEAVAVDNVDTFVRSGRFRTDITFPFVIGRDVVGTVVDRGTEVTTPRIGDRVWCNSLGHAGRQGPTSEYTTAPVERVYSLPAGVDPAVAVAVAHPAATAHLALYTHAGLRAVETVFVAGGAGHVGSALTVMASRSGAYVLVSARADDHEWCRSSGAATVLDYAAPDLAEQLRAAAPDGIDVLVDTSGRHDLATTLELLATRGRIVVMSGMDRKLECRAGDLYTHDRSLLGFAITNATAEELAEAAQHVTTLLTDGVLRPRHIEELPLSAAGEAHRRLEAGEARGTRLVLRPGN